MTYTNSRKGTETTMAKLPGKARSPITSSVRILVSAVTATLLMVAGLALVAAPAQATDPEFVTTWRTTSPNQTVTLPLTSLGDYNFSVSWGDGSSDVITAYDQAQVTHTYAAADDWDVTITGTIEGWRFANGGDKSKLRDVKSWGPLKLGNAGSYFYGASNMTITATDAPDLTDTQNLNNAFRGATALSGNSLSTWNTQFVDSMNGTFRGATAFNGDISGWNVSSVTNMANMFNGATSFNRDIGGWNIGNVSDMAAMFNGAGLSRANYDLLLQGWSTKSPKANIVFDAGSAKYTLGAATAARAILTGQYAWTITDQGETTVPGAPTGVTATREPAATTVTWNAAEPNNSAVIRYDVSLLGPASYSDTCQRLANESRSCAFPGLTNGSTYTITVTATNDVGTSLASAPATEARPQIDPPGVPLSPKAVALDGKATVTWTAPSGGNAPESYTVTAHNLTQDPPVADNPLKKCTANAPALTCDVLGLTNGNRYNFTVTAGNVGGDSAASAVTTTVTPGLVFASTWDTTNTITGASGNSSNNKQIRLPLVAAEADDGDYNFIVAWGDGTVSNITSGDAKPNTLANFTHSYAQAGEKYITITGKINGWNLNKGLAGDKERLKLLNVSSWGPLQLGTSGKQGNYFQGASNLQVTATDQLNMTGTTSLASAFRDAAAFNGDISNWDVSAVTDMSEMFRDATTFDQNIGAWGNDTSNVTTMAGMFQGATNFNQPLSDWDVSHVTSMASMFAGADAFNSEIAWDDMLAVATLDSMFAGADSFNQPLTWPHNAPADIGSMFAGATSFNANVSQLNLSNVTSLHDVFSGATAFNQDVSDWNTAGIQNFSNTFKDATNFNQNVEEWDTSSATNLSDMFSGATAFNQNLSGWDYDEVTRFNGFLKNSGLADSVTNPSGIYNYNKFLLRLLSQGVLPDTGPGTTVADRTIDSTPAKYSVGLPKSARTTLIGRGFTITDGGETTLDVPDAPTGVGQSGSTVSWATPNEPGTFSDHGSAILSYTVIARPEGGGDDLTCTTSAPATSCEFTEPALDGGTTYTFIVTATNAVGTSNPSESSRPSAPGKPAAVAGDTSATVTVTPPSTGPSPTSYQVVDTNDLGTVLCTITAPDLSCAISGLTNAQPYSFQTLASNWVGDSDWSVASDEVIPGKVFATTWKTNEPGVSGARQIRLPLMPDGSGDHTNDYDFYVNWGDGTSDRVTENADNTFSIDPSTAPGSGDAYDDATVTHTYAQSGTYDVAIIGTVKGWRFNGGGDGPKLLGVSSWGPLLLGNSGGYFHGASNMEVSATDELDLAGTTDMSYAFDGAAKFNADVATWEVDQVTNMINAFKGTATFEGNGLSGWDVGSVTQMDSMFEGSGISGVDRT